MKNCYFVLLFFVTFLSHSQSKEIVINWQGSKVYQNDNNSFKIPAFDVSHLSYSETEGLIYYTQWNSNSIIDSETVTVSNVNYSEIQREDLLDIEISTIPNQLKFNVYNTSARGKRSVFFEITPIINENGRFRRIESFTINYNATAGRLSVSSSLQNLELTSSVLDSGEWYRFYIEKSGIFKVSRNFLSQLGVSVGNIDPRTIKIYGNGGRMLPLSNSSNYPLDPVENAIAVIGESDGSFDANDYILFYGEGPTMFNAESNTNLNLFTDKTYYYLNISSGNGKRIESMPSIEQDADLQITTLQDYKYYEVDEYNLVKIGRRWFGDDFDIENQRSYEFNFPNLVTSEPIRLDVYVGSKSETPTSMTVSVNGNAVTNLNLPQVDFSGSVLASGSSFTNDVSVSSETITIDLDYNNNSNPSANAYLDYINITATRNLIYDGDQLRFKNDIVDSNPGIAEYVLTNASDVDAVWDITDRFNISSIDNTESENTFTFKSFAGEPRTFIAFSSNDYFEPKKDGTSSVVNQDIKGTILTNSSGQFQDLDYIIIAPTNFLSQAERLAQINRDQYNLSVKVVELPKIYNEFNCGNPDVTAIRNFVRYVYANASSPQNRLKYLCLFGDGSYDYKDRIQNNTNIVPAWYSLNSFSLTNSFVSDDFYAMMDDNEGTMNNGDRMDLAVGRIIAEDPQRAREMVDKIDLYYQKEAFGSWRNNVIMISDDVDVSWERILQETTDGIGNSIEEEKSFINVVKIHSDAFQQESSAAGNRYPQVATAIKDAIEVGALVVNYFGHGGEDGLAKERIFDKDDAKEINNICKFNCFVTVTCEYTKFDDPNRQTAGEFTFWNKNGGAIALITTTRQIFVTVGVSYNEVLDDYLFAFNSNEYPSMAEALRRTKIDNNIAGISQKRLVYFIGDPAMKLAFPQPNIRLTRVNDVPLGQPIDTLKALSYAKLAGEVTDINGNLLTNYSGILTATVFDKNIQRQTLANDNVTQNGEPIILDFNTLGEVIFKGQATIENGQFEFDFVVPRDIGIPVGNGKVSFYAQTDSPLSDQAGASFDVQIGGIDENAAEDNVGPVINLFMNDENFVSGGITNESPTLLAKLQDENGINTASGIGHDITAIIDGDETNPYVLNDYYQANVDDYKNGKVSFAFRDLEPGPHTLTLKAWDVYNNSSTAEIQFIVYDKDEELIIENVLNYPNPFVDYTEFWFNHNSIDPLDISVQIFTVSGKLVRTLNGQTTGGNKAVSSLSKDIVWDGRDDFGDKIGKGVYIYKLKVKSQRLNKQVEKIQKLVIL